VTRLVQALEVTDRGIYVPQPDVCACLLQCLGRFAPSATAIHVVSRRGIALLDEYEGHPSVRRLIADGYQVITF
jgi:hypothetical protein